MCQTNRLQRLGPRLEAKEAAPTSTSHPGPALVAGLRELDTQLSKGRLQVMYPQIEAPLRGRTQPSDGFCVGLCEARVGLRSTEKMA
jgi:hypothetical protein